MNLNFRVLTLNYCKYRFYSSFIKMSETETPNSLLERVRKCIPEMNSSRHKGQSGRIGVVGGSLEYTG